VGHNVRHSYDSIIWHRASGFVIVVVTLPWTWCFGPCDLTVVLSVKVYLAIFTYHYQYVHSTHLPVRLWVLGSHQERCT